LACVPADSCVRLTHAPARRRSTGGWDKNNTVGKHAGSLLTQKIATDGARGACPGAAALASAAHRRPMHA
jgi:hypothetical protein